MMLASMNLHGGHGADGTPFDVAAACCQLKADMIVLQEAWWPAGQPDPLAGAAQALGARIIRAGLADSDLRSLSIAPDTSPGQWGLAVLTALPVAGYEQPMRAFVKWCLSGAGRGWLARWRHAAGLGLLR